MSAAPGAVSGLFADRYEIDRALGEGATATVYLARDTRADMSVAIKMLRPELAGSGAADRFTKEIRRTSGLSHPRILPVLDSGDHQGQLYVVLPFMEGGTLRDRLKKEKQLPVDEALAIVRPIADALDYAHSQGLIHRDVKPENVLFTSGQAVLGDFGIARALETVLEETVTSTGIVRGTPAYMSPEQASGSKDLDGRSDLYSLACVLYEMLAGVPAFMGPSPESVIAQRFSHAPRDIRAYRPTLTPALQDALGKSFAITPADRYRTAAEFMAALESAAVATGAGDNRNTRTRFATIGAVLLATAIGAILWVSRGKPGTSPTRLDPDRIAVLPFEGSQIPYTAEELMYEGLHRWDGVDVVETFATRDAVRRRGSVSTMEDAYDVASTLGAGRVVRGRVTETGAGRIVYATLYDVALRRELGKSSVRLTEDARETMLAYSRLADSLLLRGPGDGGPDLSPRGSRNLPAVLAMLSARAALGEWALGSADSLFSRAVEHDPAFTRAHLWLAQVRTWQLLPASRWSASALRAASDTTNLSSAERLQATALAAMARSDFPRACAGYRAMARQHREDFVSWYGLGECQRRDRLVLADPASPSGWRFRSSYHQAMLAYRRAFELFPTAYRQFQSSAYESLQTLLFTSGTQLRSGMAADSQRFLARPTAAGDTVAFVPYPQEVMLGGALEPTGIEAARFITRRMFRDVALSWAAALPRNPGTKEAVAVGLEMLGDMAAARDSFRVARSLTRDPSHRVRLAVAEVLADTKAAARDPGRDLSGTLALADSLLQASGTVSRADAEVLSRIAILTGRCGVAAGLLRASVPPLNTRVLIPPTLAADAYSALPLVVLGCLPPARIPRIAESLEAVGGTAQDRLVTEYSVIGPVVGMFPVEAPALVSRLASVTNDYVLAAEDSLQRGEVAAARRVLRRQIDRRNAAGVSGFLPDAGFTEARLWLMLGDTTTAIQVLDRTLEEFATSQPMSSARAVENSVMLAALGRSLVLRAELAATGNGNPQRWAMLLQNLWSRADAELIPTVRRMQALSRR